MTDHYEGCWRVHLECAVKRIEELEAFVKRGADKENWDVQTIDDGQGWVCHFNLQSEASRLLEKKGGG